MESIAGFIAVPLEVAKQAIAAAFLDGGDAPILNRLGSITLEPHQAHAVYRLEAAIAEFGGALLCDPVGTGKTFVALTVASRYESTMVVAPAALREMWDAAAEITGVEISFVSYEGLSRGRLPRDACDFIIADEAHHARNQSSIRFASLSKLAAQSRLLLLSATPIHNRRRDLHALCSLFLGSRSSTLTAAELGRLVVRRERPVTNGIARIPLVEPLVWLESIDDETTVNSILALPPPLPASDGGVAATLVTHGLIRLWASSDAALRAGLVRRLLQSTALSSALESGVYPSQSDLTSWVSAEDTVQLAFAEIMAPPVREAGKLLRTLRTHADAVRAILEAVRLRESRDRATAQAIETIRARHRGTPVLVFSQYHDTVDAMFRLLAPSGRVAALTGRGGRVSGGTLSRSEVLHQFAAGASNRAGPRPDEIDVLITSDVLSEGVNLQTAGVVVHLDLPWTPARMEQRLGRIARMGSTFARVYAYALRPPASSETVARVESILEDKLRSASLLVDSFPSLNRRMSEDPPAPATLEQIRSMLTEWARDAPAAVLSCPLVAAVASRSPGFVAAYRANGLVSLVACSDSRVTDHPTEILAAVRSVNGPGVTVDTTEAERQIAGLRAHIAAAAALDHHDAYDGRAPGARRKAARRISTLVQNARPHDRPRIAALANVARAAISGQIGSHGERTILDSMTRNVSPDAWLTELSLTHTTLSPGVAVHEKPEVIAMVLLSVDSKVNALSRAKER